MKPCSNPSLLQPPQIKNFFYWISIFICISCTPNSEIEKYQKNRNNIIDLHDRVKEIEIDKALISNVAWSYILDDYLIVLDYKAVDKCIHIFNKNNFTYITSTGEGGEGPGELLRPLHISIDKMNSLLNVTDVGKQQIFTFELDSILLNPNYKPKEKLKLNGEQFPERYHYINDTLCIGVINEPIGNPDFQHTVGRWNMETGEIETSKYEHPKIEKRRISVTASVEHGIYVECFWHHDLMTICSLDGELLYNIYGQKWNSKNSNKERHYGLDVKIYNDRIITLYSGGDTFSKDKNGRVTRVNYPTKFIIFDINGNYLQTLETGYEITYFVYDEENNRIIMNLDDRIELAYLDLKDIIL